jgi:hypothetical protein
VSRKSAVIDGSDLHAAVRIGGDVDVAHEKPIRCCARPVLPGTHQLVQEKLAQPAQSEAELAGGV